MAEINGTDASDALAGGAENDTLIGGGGNDTLDGGGGWNVVAYWTSPSAVGVQLFRGFTSNDGFGIGNDVLVNIHGVFGSAWDDIILGSDWGDLIGGLDGNDTLEGQGGDDAIIGRAGDDRISGGTGNDTAFFGGNRGDYTVTAVDGGFTITHNATFLEWGTEVNEGTDLVTDVELFDFAGEIFTADQVLNPLAGRPTNGDDSLTGTARADRIDALAGNDTINGGAGDDTLIGNAGDDVIDGGAGYDTAAMGNVGFRGVAHGAAGGGASVTSKAGTDFLTNVEVVTFADGRLVFDENDAAAKVTRLYEAALDRLPDQLGLNFWIDHLHSGTSLSALGGAFVTSDEFTARFGSNTSNAQFVDLLYQNVLGRPADTAGRDFFVDHLNRGTSRADMLVAFSESVENKANTAGIVNAGIWDRSETAAEVARLYDTVLGRAADEAGLAGWTSWIDTGRITLSQAAGAFAASDEFQARYGALDNRGFVQALYRNTLDREADQAGLNFFTDLLDRGVASRSDAVLAFSESAEHVAITASSIGSENPAEYGILFA